MGQYWDGSGPTSGALSVTFFRVRIASSVLFFKPLRQGLFSASVSPEMVSWPLVRMSRHGAPQVNFLGSPFFDTVGLAEEGPAMEN